MRIVEEGHADISSLIWPETHSHCLKSDMFLKKWYLAECVDCRLTNTIVYKNRWQQWWFVVYCIHFLIIFEHFILAKYSAVACRNQS